MSDTIFALASAAGPAGIAVIRVSGPATGPVLQRLTGRALPTPRRASLRRLSDPIDGSVLDDGLILWFPGPASFTGEAMAELHLHGGRAVIAGVLEAIGRCPGLRPAEPGEFTRRAVLNGKLDLTAAEGLADLVAAETAMQRRQALRQLDGALGRLYRGWADRLTGALAESEAAIDFPDEDLPRDLEQNRNIVIRALSTEIDSHLRDARRGERLREGIEVAVIGPPNAGKSSLLNKLAQREAAIVTPIAGTTRDIIEVQMDLGGYPILLADTAGLREAGDAVESEGIRRALARAASADLKIALFDGTAWPALDPLTLALVDDDTLPVINKVDCRSVPADACIVGRRALPLSLATGEGLPGLLARLTELVGERYGLGEAPFLTRTRHRSALEECRAALERALTAPLPELVTEDLRLAVRALGRITGAVDLEAILDRIFAEFCIGK